jgi:release factor glutamine methyltransferase
MFLCRMKTVKDALLAFDEGLTSLYDPAEANSIKYIAMEVVTGLSKTQIRAFPEKGLSDEQSQMLTQIVLKLKTGGPIQYVLGHTEFYGLPFKVTPAVLIPRPETEELVEWVIMTAKDFKSQQNILDIGTGSGCIPITLKKHLPIANLLAVDISTKALTIAKQNAELNNVEVNFMEVDILSEDQTPLSKQRFTIITSNPPYVTNQEKTQMHTNVLNHEPHLALFVADDEPLIFYNAIADFARLHLELNGYIFFEINENFAEQTIELLKLKAFKNITLRKDIRGKDRMIRATL